MDRLKEQVLEYTTPRNVQDEIETIRCGKIAEMEGDVEEEASKVVEELLFCKQNAMTETPRTWTADIMQDLGIGTPSMEKHTI